MSDDRVDDERTLFRGEQSLVYCFDFQDFPEVTAGQTLSNPSVVISSGPALVTIGPPLVTTAKFEEIDRDGNVEKTVPAGEGVKVAITPTDVGGLKGECTVTCLVAPSGGGKIGKRVKFTVK